jgi:hypothetical protein
LLLAPSLALLFGVFKGRNPEAEESTAAHN